MIEQEYKLENQDSFQLEDIFECGQCFRWEKQADNSYIGVIKDAVIQVWQEKNTLYFQGICKKDLKHIVTEYFDLHTDYRIYKEKLKKVDNYLRESIAFGDGIRILQQDLWECIISFIISANNNIPRIKKIIERLALVYGEKICFHGKDYYFFPTPESLSRASVQDLRNLGLGFRDKRVYHTTQMIYQKEVDLEKIKQLEDTTKIRETLLQLDGVGEKVADCIMLFALKREDVFPMDVWVRRLMNELYMHEAVEEKVKNKQVQKLATDKFLGIPGIAQQYLYYWEREKRKRVK